MPAKYTLESLPEPVNKAISVRRVEPYKAAVFKILRLYERKKQPRRKSRNADLAKANKLEAKSGFITAQYNPPWIPGPFRRNEIARKF